MEKDLSLTFTEKIIFSAVVSCHFCLKSKYFRSDQSVTLFHLPGVRAASLLITNIFNPSQESG